MKALSLALMRVSLGFLMIIWAVIKVSSPERGVGLSDKYYGGLFSVADVQFYFGIFQIVLGVMVIIGLLSIVTFVLQFAINAFTAGAIWKSIIDPLGLVFENTNILFYPSLTVALACLVLIAFRKEDTLSVDGVLSRRKTD